MQNYLRVNSKSEILKQVQHESTQINNSIKNIRHSELVSE